MPGRCRVLISLLIGALLATSAPASARNYADREDVQSFAADMQARHGIEPAPLLALFHRTKPVPAAIRLVMPPRDPGIRSWRAYRARFVEPRRIAAGRRFMADHAAELARAEQRWGVPREIIAAIIGIETIYGRHTGNFGTFAALTTLAFDYPPRADLFRAELEELLLLAREQDRTPLNYKGSYAGALGLPQFLPSSWRKYAVDFDDDGDIDLLGSVEDAIGSVANFLAQHGWQAGQPIADQVMVTKGDAIVAAGEGIEPRKTPAQWQGSGLEFTKVSPGGTAPAELPTALIDLVTPNAETEYRLGYRNFFVITRYNRSSFYAAAVMDLARELATDPAPAR